MAKKVKLETVIRTIVLVVALINQILAICGKEQLPIYENEIVQLCSIVVTICSTVWAWWKNNSFTDEAIQADEFLERLRGYDDDNL